MTPLKLLEQALEPLRKFQAFFAIAGGLAASFYRLRPRLTNDVDICLLATPEQATQKLAIEIISALGLKPFYGWIASEGKLPDATPLIIGKVDSDDLGPSLDILLPSLPWLKQAVVRAQENVVDFGFASLPTLTPEDLLIAKQYALSIEPNRFQDRDDIQSILNQQNTLDWNYLSNELIRLRLPKLAD